MSSPGNYDNSANVPLWMSATVNLKTDSASAISVFDNTTAGAFITDQTIGIFGVDDNEAVANNTPAGWVKKVTGSGGRVGRVTYEVLSASTSMIPDVVYKDTSITTKTTKTKSDIS